MSRECNQGASLVGAVIVLIVIAIMIHLSGVFESTSERFVYNLNAKVTQESVPVSYIGTQSLIPIDTLFNDGLISKDCSVIVGPNRNTNRFIYFDTVSKNIVFRAPDSTGNVYSKSLSSALGNDTSAYYTYNLSLWDPPSVWKYNASSKIISIERSGITYYLVQMKGLNSISIVPSSSYNATKHLSSWIINARSNMIINSDSGMVIEDFNGVPSASATGSEFSKQWSLLIVS